LQSILGSHFIADLQAEDDVENIAYW